MIAARALPIVSCLLFAALAQQPANPPAPARRTEPTPPAAPRPGATAIRFEATLFELKLAPERIAALDTHQLADAGPKSEDFTKVLATFGKARVLYRFDDAVSSGTQVDLVIGANRPFVRGRQTTKDGNSAASVEYQDVGVKLNVRCDAEWGGSDKTAITIGLEVSGIRDSALEMSKGIAAPIFYKLKESHFAITQAGQPVVFLLADASTPDADGQATAVVARVIVGRE